jgi:hypothetical protein
MLHILGLPLKTLIIVGGLFILSAFAPLFTAYILKNKKGKWNDE